MSDTPSGRTVALEMGGYNCVIQLSSAFILRFLQQRLRFNTLWSSVIPREQFFAALDRLATSSDTLTRLRSADHVDQFALIVGTELVRLRFTENQRVCLTLRGDLVANNADATLPPSWDDLGLPQFSAFGGSGKDSPSEGKQTQPVGIRSIGGVIGQLTVDVCLRYHVRTDPPRGRIEVYADGGDAEVLVTTSRGLDPLAELITGVEGAVVLDDFDRAGRITLTPRLSLIGAVEDRVTSVPVPPPSSAVTEFERLDVEAFAVARDRRQALSLCCVVQNGILPSPSEVQHFLIDQDYGVRSDTGLINRVLIYKWRLGCFVRSVRVQKRITVRRPSRDPEPATLVGFVSLDTFDGAVVEFNGAAREAIVRLNGKCTITPTALELADIRIPASELPRDLFRATPLTDVPWAFPFNFTDSSEWPTDPDARLLLEAIYREGVNPLMRPFAADPRTTAACLVLVREANIDGVHKTLQFRGSIPRTFE